MLGYFSFIQTLLSIPTNDLGDFGHLAIGVAGIFTLWRLGKMKIDARLQVASFL
tara:strand:+ start:3540 stop:3701 length:162 start_codon:yes stop_codon:yes gene_type:complete